MNSSDRSKWQVRLAVLAIFVIGFAAGALSIHLYRERPWWSGSGEGQRRSRFEQTLDKLSLTADQRSQVDSIFDDARAQLAEMRKESEPKFRELRKKTDDRLQAVLTPEQWDQFKQMTESRHRRPHRNDKDR